MWEGAHHIKTLFAAFTTPICRRMSQAVFLKPTLIRGKVASRTARLPVVRTMGLFGFGSKPVTSDAKSFFELKALDFDKKEVDFSKLKGKVSDLAVTKCADARSWLGRCWRWLAPHTTVHSCHAIPLPTHVGPPSHERRVQMRADGGELL